MVADRSPACTARLNWVSSSAGGSLSGLKAEASTHRKTFA
jgi:hypothetical protein